MAVRITATGFKEARKGIEEWAPKWWQQVKDIWIENFEEMAQYIRSNHPLSDVRNNVRTQVDGGTDLWESFQLKLIVDSPAAISTEFGGTKRVENQVPSSGPIMETKSPISSNILTSIILPAAVMSAAFAIFWNKIETPSSSVPFGVQKSYGTYILTDTSDFFTMSEAPTLTSTDLMVI